MSNERSQSGVFIVLGVIVLAVVGLFIAKMHGHHQAADIPSPDPDPAPLSDKITINFYLDGSGSIKHFLLAPAMVNGRPATNYMKVFLDKCGTELVNAWKDPHVNFFRFGGGHVDPIPSDSSIKSAPQPSTDGGEPSVLGADPRNMESHPEWFNAESTSIEVPIEHRLANNGDDQRQEVKVIVTDLYESQGSVELPANALARKYLSGDKSAVDILAVRNPSDGNVEDMPGAGKKMLHDAANTMPFYIIVAGPTADVRNVMRVLVEGTGLNEAKKEHLTTEFFFSRTPQPHSMETMTPSSTDGKWTLVDGDYDHRKISLVELSKGTVEVSWPDHVKPIGDTIKLYDTQTLKPVAFSPPPATAATPATGQPTGDSSAATAKWIENPVAESAIDDCAKPTLLCRKIDKSKLPNPGTYIFRFDRIATDPPQVLEPDSPEIRKWSIEESNAEAISNSKVTQFPNDDEAGAKAGKTPDLSKFLKALQRQTYHDPLTITTYYVYLQAD